MNFIESEVPTPAEGAGMLQVKTNDPTQLIANKAISVERQALQYRGINVYIHPTADVSPIAQIGDDTYVSSQAEIGDRAILGKNCQVGKAVYIERDVMIGNAVKIQNQASICKGVVIESGALIGPYVCFTNSRYPRAITSEGEPRPDNDWEVECTFVGYGATIGAGAIILPGVRIGAYAMIAAGALVTHDVPDHNLAVGQPAQLRGYVCRCGRPLQLGQRTVSWHCPHCRESYIFNS